MKKSMDADLKAQVEILFGKPGRKTHFGIKKEMEQDMKKRDSLSQIKLSDQQKEKLNDEIKAFYLDVRGEEIGLIQQMQLVELFEQKLAPIIYNKALDDAKRWFSQMLDNIDSDYYTLYKNED